MTVTRRNCSAAFQSTLPHGSDPLMTLSQWETGISIHAPSRERPISSLSRAASSNFNPRSLTGATRDKAAYTCCPRHFNPRSLTGATRRKKKATPAFWISIHAPSRERHSIELTYVDAEKISIHAPSRERRLALPSRLYLPVHFNPRSLTGATLQKSLFVPCRVKFQSTLPHGSDDSSKLNQNRFDFISIHAPSRERLSRFSSITLTSFNFNPRSLTGATIRPGTP